MYEKMKQEVQKIVDSIKDPKLRKMFVNCFYNTLDTAVNYLPNGEVYVLTGDIPAMWLRDSSASVIQYLEFASIDEDVKNLFRGLIKRQLFYILVDPYANSFNESPNNHGHIEDEGLKTPYTWERKFEIDSLCYPIWLTYKFYKETKDVTILDDRFIQVCNKILEVFEIEMQHDKKSQYYHYRPGEKEEFCIPNHGHGGEVNNCGLIWSGYRPSDDACKYGFFIPGNMFASVILKQMAELLNDIDQVEIASKALNMKKVLDEAIEKYAVIDHEKYGKMYVYETDGLGHYLLMDDANIPSLLTIPYFGYKNNDDPIYQNTRNYCLSLDNPFYFEGKVLTGVGSPHTPKDYVWHIGVVAQGLTAIDDEEKLSVINMVLNSDDNTTLTHEGVHKDDQSIYTRPWFSWSNSLFTYFILKNLNLVQKEVANEKN